MSIPVDLINRRNSPPMFMAEVVKEHRFARQSAKQIYTMFYFKELLWS
jgi:hypothetical protein